jgi:LPS-assembly lipoprotein
MAITQYPCGFSAKTGWKRPWILRTLLLILSGLVVSACGFTLRGASSLPYETVAVTAPDSSQLAADLRRTLAATSNARVVTDAKTAALQVQVLSELRDKQVLSVNAQGRVREYTLFLRVSVKALDAQGKEVLAPTEFVQKRDVSFNEGVVLAKESEEALLYREMQSDIMQNIVRRVASIPAPGAVPTATPTPAVKS